MSLKRCTHQWSVWQSAPKSTSETRWCHVCNSVQKRPKANHYQQFERRTRPSHIKHLPPCKTPDCNAKAGEPCRDSNETPVYVWHHGNRQAT